jgi:hypothetical protein
MAEDALHHNCLYYIDKGLQWVTDLCGRVAADSNLSDFQEFGMAFFLACKFLFFYP